MMERDPAVSASMARRQELLYEKIKGEAEAGDGLRPKLQPRRVSGERAVTQPVKMNGGAGLLPLPQASMQTTSCGK